MTPTTALRNLADRRITIIGLAREGIALARVLVTAGARVTVSDIKPAEALQEALGKVADLPLRYVLGGHPPELLDTDLIFLSPGVPLDAPIVQAARAAQLPISTETRLFVEICPVPVSAITGSSGKTTTTTLVGEMCKAEGWHTYVGGNIGQPLIGHLSEIVPGDRVVMELSSFQLDLFRPWDPATRGIEQFPQLSRGKSPHIAAILNITPNHLDRHATMADYIDAKKQILLYQTARDYAVLNQDDPITRELCGAGAAQVSTFSMREPVAEGAYLAGNEVRLRWHGEDIDICRADQIRLRGRHNIANVLAACAIAAAADISPTSMAAVATRFAGVAHRLELVREWRGVRYYNDSIATSPERAIAALESFSEPIVLLAGGRDKHLPWDHWAATVTRQVRHLVLFGEAAPLIEQAMRDHIETYGPVATVIHRCDTMEQAVQVAAHVAQTGDVVLLSPGGTSFDAYRDYAERGARFRELVMRLTEGEEQV